MKEYNKDLDIVFSPMSDETMSWLDELFSTCKRFGVDYYNASEKDRVFVEAVARKNYGLKTGICQRKKPLLPWSRSLGFTGLYKVFGFDCCGKCSTMIPRPFGLGIFCGGRYRTCTRSGLPFRSSCLPVQQEKRAIKKAVLPKQNCQVCDTG